MAVAFFSPNSATTILASQVAALVCSKAVPRLMPTPNRITVPQGMRGCATFQVRMPKPGMNISATAVIVVVLVSNLCRTPSVAQKAIKDGNGTAMLKTVSGGSLWVMMNGPSNIVLKDEAGNIAHISTYDVNQSNGVIHVIDRVVMPK